MGEAQNKRKWRDKKNDNDPDSKASIIMKSDEGTLEMNT